LGVVLRFCSSVGQHNARIVDEDVQPRIGRCQLSRRGVNAGRILDIELNGSHARVCPSCLLQRRLSATGDDDPVPELVKCLGKPSAYSGAAASDEDGVPCKIH
jgi:hypothetical protein